MGSAMQNTYGQRHAKHIWAAPCKTHMGSAMQNTYRQRHAKRIWAAPCKTHIDSAMQNAYGQRHANHIWAAPCKTHMGSVMQNTYGQRHTKRVFRRAYGDKFDCRFCRALAQTPQETLKKTSSIHKHAYSNIFRILPPKMKIFR